ncbi:MAG: ParB N-terminal domain-containing protein [Ruminococcus sp.]|uniref:ParB/Srx family N-terminal domain-containing protein n=1 Tax=Ruminococcus sp. TaxID=41978 RepID=UPI001B1443FB|nr:ParB/Srx family N-terminal domain-containing protein [Ruminococcus sp.]MBO7473123.1 ParB N-terminal domain-containing protein [Ruminococcus sp.]
MNNNLIIEYVSLDAIKPYERNAKLHPQEQIEQIKKSITDLGFNDPIAVWKNNEVIEGHGRLIAAKELGLEEVPVIRLDNLTDEQLRAGSDCS